MKFLHLSDLHIGKSVNNYPMIEEQKHAIEQINKHIKTHSPAAIIIAGDIYDRAIPSVEAINIFDDLLTTLAKENITAMIISGNHDSPDRTNYASRLLTDKQLYIYGAYDGSIKKITLTDQYGEINFWLLPFIKPPNVRKTTGQTEKDNTQQQGAGESTETYDEAIKTVMETADIDYTARNVLISHQFYTKAGAKPERSESEINPIGGLDAVDTAHIERFDYAALGHLHGKQNAGAEHIRYSGSPVKYSFSEWRQEKAALLVELKEKGNLTITPLPLTPIHDMREIKGELEKLISDEITSLADKNDYLRAILTDEEEIIDPMGKLRSAYPNIMSLSFENTRTKINIDTITTDAETIEKLSPYELFGEFFLETQGAAMSAQQAGIVRELLEKDGEE